MTNMDQEQRDTVGHAAPTGVQPMRDVTIAAAKDSSVQGVKGDVRYGPKVKQAFVQPSPRPSTPLSQLLPRPATPTTPVTPSTTTTTITQRVKATKRASTPTPTPKPLPPAPTPSPAKTMNEKIKLHEVNPYLTCLLCTGYLIDATTISECLHSFCRSCIIRFLQENSHCPECEVVINKTKPNLKLDKTLQDIVYKLVPELYLNEMTRRRQFYASRPPAAKAHLSPEQRGDDTERIVFNARDKFSLCLEYVSDDSTPDAIHLSTVNESTTAKDVTTIINNNTLPNGNVVEVENNMRRYLQCPGMCRIDVLKKFVRNKYTVDTQNFHIDILHKRVPLPDHYTLIDIAYIYSWKRNEPMKFFFRITDIQQVRDRFDFYDKEVTTTLEHNVCPTPVASVSPVTVVFAKDSDNVKVQSAKISDKVKKPKSVRFHSDVKFPLATSTPVKPKVKSEKHPNGMVGRPKCAQLKPKVATRLLVDEPIDVNCDAWLREQVKRVSKELKKCKSKEAKEAKDKETKNVKDTKDVKDAKTIVNGGVNANVSVNGASSLNGHCASDKPKVMDVSDTKVRSDIADKKVDIKSVLPRVDPHINAKSAGSQQQTIPLDLVTRNVPSKTPSSDEVQKEEFLKLVNLQAKNSLLKQSPLPVPAHSFGNSSPIANQSESQRKSPPYSPSRKSPKPDSPKCSKQGQKRKHSSPIPDVSHHNLIQGGLGPKNGIKEKDNEKEKVKKPKFTIKSSTKQLKIPSPKITKLPKTPKTPKSVPTKITVPTPQISPVTSRPLTPKPVAPKPVLPPAKTISKPSKPTEMSVDLEEPNLKSLLNTCKIPSSLSITCVNGGAADRESQIKPVINHIEILKLPEVREAPSPDSSKLETKQDQPRKAEESKSISKEKLEKVGTTIKLQTKQEAVKNDEKETKSQAQSELSITITMEKDGKDDAKAAGVGAPSPGGGHPGMGVHLNLPKIIQPTPTGRNLNSFQKMFEETVRKRNDVSSGGKAKANANVNNSPNHQPEKVEVKSVPIKMHQDEKNTNSKRNILEIASQLSKKSKMEQETKEQEAVVSPGQGSMKTNAQGKVAIPRNPKCDTLSNLHSNTLALNYSVSINQKPPPKSPSSERENVVTSTTPVDNQFGKWAGKSPKQRVNKVSPRNQHAHIRHGEAKTSPKPIAPKEKHRASPPVISPKVGIPMPTLSPLSQGSPQSNARASPSGRNRSTPPQTQSPAYDVNQLQEKYNLQNLAQLSASFNFPAAYGHQPHQAMAAIQQAMLMNCMQQTTRPWFNMPPANMVQYEKFLQSLSAAQSPTAPAQNLLTKDN